MTMPGLMQDWPLTLDRIIDHAAAWHGRREIVSRSVEGPIVRTTYAASSIEIENLAVGHPKAALCAVIGAAHPVWGERPVLLVKLKAGESSTREEFLTHLDGRIAKWWMPDDILFVDDIPLGATGKLDKKRIRAEMMVDYVLPTARTESVAG